MDTAVEFKSVRFCYENVCAVNDISLKIPSKKLTILVGPNGGGKSTLIKLLVGLLNPDKGFVNISNNFAIGYVAQGSGFDDSFPITVNEVILTGTMCDKIHPFFRYSKNDHIKAQKAIEMVGLEGFENRSINQLSGGQLRRVLIARALAADADIIVLDEPDSHLDPEALDDLYSLLNSLKEEKTIIMASHNINSVFDIADQAVYVDRNIKHFDTPELLKEKLARGLMV